MAELEILSLVIKEGPYSDVGSGVSDSDVPAGVGAPSVVATAVELPLAVQNGAKVLALYPCHQAIIGTHGRPEKHKGRKFTHPGTNVSNAESIYTLLVRDVQYDLQL